MSKFLADKKVCACETIAVKNVPRQNILKPAHSKFRLLNQEFKLCHRIIITVDEGQVPFAAVGTVVGIDEDYLDVLFDTSDIYFNDLDGRCPGNRGATIHKSACLNLNSVQVPTSMAQPKYTNSRNPSTFKTTPYRQENKWNSPKTGDGTSRGIKIIFPSQEAQRPQNHQNGKSFSPVSNTRQDQMARNNNVNSQSERTTSNNTIGPSNQELWNKYQQQQQTAQRKPPNIIFKNTETAQPSSYPRESQNTGQSVPSSTPPQQYSNSGQTTQPSNYPRPSQNTGKSVPSSLPQEQFINSGQTGQPQRYPRPSQFNNSGQSAQPLLQSTEQTAGPFKQSQRTGQTARNSRTNEINNPASSNPLGLSSASDASSFLKNLLKIGNLDQNVKPETIPSARNDNSNSVTVNEEASFQLMSMLNIKNNAPADNKNASETGSTSTSSPRGSPRGTSRNRGRGRGRGRGGAKEQRDNN
jgi:hypothetical protein